MSIGFLSFAAVESPSHERSPRSLAVPLPPLPDAVELREFHLLKVVLDVSHLRIASMDGLKRYFSTSNRDISV
ncbi:uncharacterized protein G2W53_040517 [Senna tora]|uniref:Uncharacterized protein n=1 Tax=Senna tora TaxID=362788 RepID=A0A834SDJ3_9FABA|nr:uncharacterized protein G2W53_040517 [Senna tora]